ncbi:F-box/RNI/FBD-like domain protein [Medicago truncatula]|uniref:F-box/RNI/FBD-like domain protein n=1 Tax=Medicago truncatula TaxID=3880 RepID=G7KLC8_MEDTR|nr:F-box/RNI/FBD-like domain protein [Medicago truncatula]
MAPTRKGTDRISDLPDEILHHILSFLPSSQIALTSLLSKRWNPLWLTIPNADRISALRVELLCRILSRLPTKQIFVASLLSRRWRLLRQRILDINLDDMEGGELPYADRQLPIKTLTLLSASRFCNSASLCHWLYYAIYWKAEHVDFTFLQQHSSATPIYLPNNILCSTLVVLNLNGNGVLTIDCVYESYTNLPNLEKLHMTKVHFLKLKYLIQILSVCPLLEDLLIKNVTTNDDNDTLDALTKQRDKLLKPFPKLLKAHISDSSSISSFLPLKLFYNVEFLRAQVAVQTPLKLFDYVAPVQTSEQQDTTQFFNLTHMELSFEKEDEEYYHWDWLKKFIRACPSLQSIVIHKIVGGGVGYGLSGDDHNSLHPQFVPNCNAFDHCNKSSLLEILEARKVSFTEISSSK